MLPTPPSPPPQHQVAFLLTRFFICRILPPSRHAPPKQFQARGRECQGAGGSLEPRAQPWGGSGGGGQEDFLRNKLVMGHWGVPVLVVGWRLGVAVAWGSAFSFAVLRQHLLGGGHSRPSWGHH